MVRHQVRGRALGRTSAHKKALQRNILAALFTHERIVTTVAKAKEFRPAAERMITLAKTRDLAHIRRAISYLPDKTVVKKLFDVIGPRFANRNGGYTRVLKLAGRRLGDNAPLAMLELVERTPKAEEPTPAPAAEEKKADTGAKAKKPAKRATAAAK